MVLDDWKKPVEPPQNNKQKTPRNYLRVTPTSHLAFTREAPPEVPVAPASFFFSHWCVSVVFDVFTSSIFHASCPDQGVVLGPLLSHLEAMVGHVGLCWSYVGGDWLMEGGIFVGHEPFHLRAPQYAQIGGLFLGQCWAIWKRCWPKMAVHVGHPVHFGNLNAKKTPYWPKLYPNCLKETNPENYHELPAELLFFLNIDLSSTFGQRNLNRFLSPPKINLGVGVLLDHPRKPSNLTLQNSTSPQIGQKYQTIPNWPKFTQTVWRNQAMRT